MKTINNYILEKLKINKNTEIEETIFSKYSVGDLCLFIVEVADVSNGPDTFILVDVVKIISESQKNFTIKFLTHYGVKDNKDKFHFSKETKQDEKNNFIVYRISNKRCGTLIPKQYADDIINALINGKNYPKLDFWRIVRNTEMINPNSNAGGNFPVYKLRNEYNYSGLSLNHYWSLGKEDSEKIKEIINETDK